MKLTLKQLTMNGMVAAIYVVIALFLPSYGPLQLRLSEMFAHLPVLNKRYSIGLILGVTLANIRSEFGIYDVIFGTLHTIVSLWIVSLIIKEADSLMKRMVVNTIVFSVMSFILALMVGYLSNQMAVFWTLYASFAVSIAIVMAVTIPIMLLLDRRIDFNKVMEGRQE